MAGHFYPLPPTFIGGRQPYAPKLGIAQSGPPSQPSRALATLGIILASWSQATPALPKQVRIAPLIPVAAVADAPPRRSTANLNVILAQWQAPYAQLPSRADVAPLIPAVAVTANPPYTRKQFENVDAAWRYDPTIVITLTSIAPFAETPADPDAAPIKGWKTVDVILGQWKAREYLPPQPKGLASLLPAAATPDAPPVRSHALLKSILDQSLPALYRPQISKPIAALLPAPVVPDSPPPTSLARLNVLLQQWTPRAWWPLPRSPALIPPQSDAAPTPSGVNLAVILEQWQRQQERLPAANRIAPLIQSTPDSPPAPTDVTLNLIIDQWNAPTQTLPQASRIAALIVPEAASDAPLPLVRTNLETIGGWWERWQPLPEMPDRLTSSGVASDTIIGLTFDINGSFIPVIDPDDIRTFTPSWVDELPEGITLISVAHAVPSPLTMLSESNTATTSSVRITGARHGQMYLIECEATLSNGDTMNRAFPLRAFNG